MVSAQVLQERMGLADTSLLKERCLRVLSCLSCPTLCDAMDCSSPGSSAHGLLQARILEWLAMLSSRGFFQPRHRTGVPYVSCVGRRVLYH